MCVSTRRTTTTTTTTTTTCCKRWQTCRYNQKGGLHNIVFVVSVVVAVLLLVCLEGVPLVAAATAANPASAAAFGIIPRRQTNRNHNDNNNNNNNIITHDRNNNNLKQMVLGTVALPFVPGGNPMEFLNGAVERGFYRFDLARTYAGGKSEKVFGQWLLEHNNSPNSNVSRENIQIITKGGMGNDKYGNPDREMCTRESLRSELSASLEALNTDYVDLYMLHRDDVRIDVRHFVDWMNELYQDGMIRGWGVSNWSLRRIHQAYTYAKAEGLQPPKATSPQLSLAVPSSDIWPSTHSVSCPSKMGEIEWYRQHEMEVMGWEALAKGFMAVPTLWRQHEVHISNFHGPNAEVGSDLWRLQRIQRAYCTPANYERRKIAMKLAREASSSSSLGGTKFSLAQVALLYSMAKGDHVSVLVGADRIQHLDEMAAIRDYTLDEEAINCLTAASMNPKLVERVAKEVKSWTVDTKNLVYSKKSNDNDDETTTTTTRNTEATVEENLNQQFVESLSRGDSFEGITTVDVSRLLSNARDTTASATAATATATATATAAATVSNK